MSTEDTAASECGADAQTSIVEPAAETGQGSELAWSLNDAVDDQVSHSGTPEQPTRHGLIVSLGLVALVVGTIGSVILLAAALFSWHHSKQAELSRIPAPPTTQPVAAPPPPPAPQPTPALTFTDEQDQRMLSQLTAQDYTITDAAEVVQHAHRYCTLVQQGIPADNARQTVASEALSAKPVGDEIGIESRRFYPNEIARTDDAWLDISRQAINAYYPHCGKLADLNGP